MRVGRDREASQHSQRFLRESHALLTSTMRPQERLAAMAEAGEEAGEGGDAEEEEEEEEEE